MSAKQQRRQKKLAKKRSKQLSEQKARARQKNALCSTVGKMRAAASGPIERCLISEELLDPSRKFGTVLISRRMTDGRLGCARILIDGMCRGVKLADGFACHASQLTELIDELSKVETLRPYPPEVARKLVESAIEFARRFELEPNGGYQKVAPIWGDIDSSQCDVEFQLGNEEGRPVYISGPNETMDDARRVVEKLERTAGEGNFVVDYETLLGDEESLASWGDDPELDVDIDEDVPVTLDRPPR